jgi:hypothetical protein
LLKIAATDASKRAVFRPAALAAAAALS